MGQTAVGIAAVSGWPRIARGDAAGDWKAMIPPLGVKDRSAGAPTAPVAIARCRSFELERLAASLSTLFDQLGGLKKVAGGKTVTIKLNVTGDGRRRLGGRPSERTYQVHPNLIEVLCGLLVRAGAKRIYLVESYYRTVRPEQILESHRWRIDRLKSAAEHRVAFEDTRNRGSFKDYVKIKVPWGGYVFPAYHLNRRYVDTDVCISVAKLKNHAAAGMTGAVKNLFGITPTALYGGDAPNEDTTDNRGVMLHFGRLNPPPGVTQEIHNGWDELPRNFCSYYRVPRVTADVMGVRPLDLSIVEGIESCKGGEGPWIRGTRPVKPGVILAGRNAVTLDAVATAVMGYDPLAKAGEKPWHGDNHLELLARAGVGTHDPGRIEVIGLPLEEALHEYEPGVNGWVRRNLLKA